MLYDDKEYLNGPSNIELPPLPLTTTFSFNFNSGGYLLTIYFFIKFRSTIFTGTSYSMAQDSSTNLIRTACPNYVGQNGTSLATVQSDFSVMNIKDVLHQPLVTTTIQQQNCMFLSL